MRASDPDAERRRLYAMLSTQLDDPLLATRREILLYLNHLGAFLRSGQPITWRRVAYWAEHKGFPLLPGIYGRRTRAAAVSSKAAITAWLLSQPNNAFPRMFRVMPAWERHRRDQRARSTAPELT